MFVLYGAYSMICSLYPLFYIVFTLFYIRFYVVLILPAIVYSLLRGYYYMLYFILSIVMFM